MPPTKSVADLLTSFGLGRLAQAGQQQAAQQQQSAQHQQAQQPPSGKMKHSASMMQLLAALDSPTGRLTEAATAAASDGPSNSATATAEKAGDNMQPPSLQNFPSSASVNSLRGLLRSASSNCSLADLGGAEGLIQNLSSVDLQQFAALARSGSLQNALAAAAGDLSGGGAAAAPASAASAAMWPPPSVGGAAGSSGGSMGPPTDQRSPPGKGSGATGHSTDGMLIPDSQMMNARAFGQLFSMSGLQESPSVSSLVELVKSSSATSLVDLLHSYSATNLASMAKDE